MAGMSVFFGEYGIERKKIFNRSKEVLVLKIKIFDITIFNEEEGIIKLKKIFLLKFMNVTMKPKTTIMSNLCLKLNFYLFFNYINYFDLTVSIII